MREASAYAPGHLTGLFQIWDHPEDPLLKGSRGAGVSINLGVKTKVEASMGEGISYSISINGVKDIYAPVSENVINKFIEIMVEPAQLEVQHIVETPMTAGFGSSGGGALSLALALNRALDLRLSFMDSANIAHIAEIECRTGLGSVTAALRGGFGVSIVPGGPGINEAIHYEDTGGLRAVFIYFGPIPTKEALSDQGLRRRINEIGERYVDELQMSFTPERFMNYSRDFAEKMGLITPRVRRMLMDTDEEGYICSMVMFGEVVFSVVEADEAYDLAGVMQQASPGNRVEVVEIDDRGARYL
jgi:pantoate kinase